MEHQEHQEASSAVTAPVRALDASDPAWLAPSPTLARPVLCAGTPLDLPGYRRALATSELGWLHAALSGVLGRGHDPGGPHTTLRKPAWSVIPWATSAATPAASCGWAVVWWDEADAAAVSGQSYTARIGRVPCRLRFGAITRLHTPPQYLPGSYAVRLSTRTLVTVASTQHRGEREGERVAYCRASERCLESALVTVARKLAVQVDAATVRAHVIADRTAPARARMCGKVGEVRGWSGQVDVLLSAPARWLVECAARGIGLGARSAYGMGRVAVRALPVATGRFSRTGY